MQVAYRVLPLAAEGRKRGYSALSAAVFSAASFRRQATSICSMMPSSLPSTSYSSTLPSSHRRAKTGSMGSVAYAGIYNKEMGQPIARRILSFSRPLALDGLPEIKLATNEK